MFIARLCLRGQPAPLDLPGWPDVFTAVVVRDILRSSPLIPEAEVVETTDQPDLFPKEEAKHGNGQHPRR
jgi:hypothetical protein